MAGGRGRGGAWPVQGIVSGWTVLKQPKKSQWEAAHC